MGLFKSNNPFRHTNVDDVGPPPGPPPSHAGGSSDYGPPSGPPPGYQQHQDNDYGAPPPGPPPGKHDWQSVPLPEDTSNYPPPPALFSGHDRSWANNATEQQADEGERWCQLYPLLPPNANPPPPHHHQAPRLVKPLSNTFSGSVGPGGVIKTDARCGDCCVTAQPPAYLAAAAPAGAAAVYFEVVVRRDLGADAGFGLGFAALPYPPFRMPGWHRGSLAVHSDDGHRYVNDRWGGVDFVRPFGTRGTVVGIGLRFGGGGGMGVECFFTRDGVVEGSFDVNGTRDAERDLEPLGVQGYHDLVAAVGAFGKVEVEVVLDPARWLYKGAKN